MAAASERPAGGTGEQPDERQAGAAPPPDEPALPHLAATALPALALVAVVAVAATGTGLLLPGADLDRGRAVAARLLGLALVVGGWIALRRGWGRGGTPVVGDQRTRALAAAAGIFAALVLLTAPHSDIELSRRVEPTTTTTSAPLTPESTAPTTTSTTAPVTTAVRPTEELRPGDSVLAEVLVLLMIAVLLAVALAGLLRAWGIRPNLGRGPLAAPPRPDVSPVDVEAAEAGLTASLAAAVEGDDARAAIVAAYARLLDALAEAGGRRRPEEAPHEHLHRVLGPLGVRPEPTHRLAELFVLARFSVHDVTDDHRRAAVASLESALDDLRRLSPASPAVPSHP